MINVDWAEWAVGAGAILIAMSLGIGAGYVAANSNNDPSHAICQQSHREVVLIPTVCGNHDICQRPIVTEVCDRVEMPAPRPDYRGKYE